jgi:hypothetical protein
MQIMQMQSKAQHGAKKQKINHTTGQYGMPPILPKRTKVYSELKAHCPTKHPLCKTSENKVKNLRMQRVEIKLFMYTRWPKNHIKVQEVKQKNPYAKQETLRTMQPLGLVHCLLKK